LSVSGAAVRPTLSKGAKVVPRDEGASALTPSGCRAFFAFGAFADGGTRCFRRVLQQFVP
jgi:hypothetical protein